MQIDDKAAVQDSAVLTTAPTTLYPLSDQLVVLPVDPEEQTKGGLYIPDVHRERPFIARVLAVGPLVKGDVKARDLVLYARYAGQETSETVDLDGAPVERQVLVLPESQLLAIVGGGRRPAPF